MADHSRKSQYETQLKKWDFKKYATGTAPRDWKAVNYKVEKAKKRGKQPQVYWQGQPVNDKVLGKHGFLTSFELNTFKQGTGPAFLHRLLRQY